MKTAYQKWQILILGLALSVLITPASAQAENKVKCKVFVVEASNGEKGIDASLQQFASLFVQKPFSAFNRFQLVDQKVYQLTKGTPLQLSLPSQLSGTLEFRGKHGHQLKLNLTLSRANETPIVIEGKTASGVPFIAAGLKSPRGRWVFAVKCNQ